MAFVDVALAVGATVGLEGTAAVIGGGAIIGAGVGAGYSAITGDGNILNSALTGGLIGGAGAYGLGAMGAGGAGVEAAMAGPFWGAAAGSTATPALAATGANTTAGAALANASADPILAASNLSGMSASEIASMNAAAGTGAGTGLTGSQMLGYGLAGSAALSLLGNMNTPKLSSQSQGQNQAYIRPYQYAANPTNNYPTSYNGLGSSAERTYFKPTMTAQPIYKAATGGLTPPPNVDFMGQNAFPMSQQVAPHYAVPSQMPTSAQQVKASYEPDTNPLTGEPIAMAGGGKAEEDDGETYKEKLKRYKKIDSFLSDMKESGVSIPDLGDSISESYAPRSEPSRLHLSALPQGFVESPQMKGVMGRVGANYALDRDTQLMAGLGGFAGKDRGALAVKPDTMDVGISKKVGPGYLSGQYQRSLTGQQPARYMANYAIPMAEGGTATADTNNQPVYGIENINPSVFGAVGAALANTRNAPPPQSGLLSQAQQAPAQAPGYTMATNPAVKAYNDAIMQKAIQTYVTPQTQAAPQTAQQGTGFGGLAQALSNSSLGGALAPQGYAPPQAPGNFDQGLLDQWRAANPNAQSYNSLTQRYGAAIPSQSQYDAFKAQKDQEAADLLAQSQIQPYSYGDSGGGGATGGLPRDFAYAMGGGVGHLGGYSDGGRMLKGPGDGMSDNIPATIGGKQPARLADGEFVVPADVVSHLGNGSTDAGAKRLYAMMDNVRKARTGSKKQGKQIKAEKYLPT